MIPRLLQLWMYRPDWGAETSYHQKNAPRGEMNRWRPTSVPQPPAPPKGGHPHQPRRLELTRHHLLTPARQLNPQSLRPYLCDRLHRTLWDPPLQKRSPHLRQTLRQHPETGLPHRRPYQESDRGRPEPVNLRMTLQIQHPAPRVYLLGQYQ